jgi:hypothetical protein
MSIKAINQNVTIKNNRNSYAQQQSFTGSFNPIVTVMDGIEKGGFAASFIAQDGIGMVAPRIYEGLNRNRKKDENGKKTGPLNWEFARREGIREVLSGPSAFLIPLGMLSVIKKASGAGNNVYVSHIEALGEDFASYAAKNKAQMGDVHAFKKGYYSQVFENVLSNSTDNKLQPEKIKQYAETFAEKLVNAEELREKKDKKGAKKLIGEINSEYIKIRKGTVSSSNNELGAVIKINGKNKTVGTNIKRLTQSLTDYTDDALKHVSHNAEDIADAVRKFSSHRIGTRVLTNLGMWGAVVGFYTLIPKLYNLGIKQDPGLKGLEQPDDKEQDKKQIDKTKDPSFTGLASSASKVATKDGAISKLLGSFEFNGASMTVPAMLTLLFGFCLPPRYINAKSDKERKEILVRDISSFGAILFGAKALSRGFSDGFAKLSGFALNIKPEDHQKGILNKLKNYFTAGSGIEVLSSEQIVTKYSNLEEYKDGINGFFDFLQNNGGNVKKVLNVDANVKENAEAIMKEFANKSLKDANIDEIKEAFKKAEGSAALDKIYTAFRNVDNKFINRAKTFNSAFGFASTILIVPVFMMWLARYCENMTKKAVEKEKAMKAQNSQSAQPVQQARPVIVASNQPTMSGFLNN